jgi:hypothetical protein
MMGTKTHAKTSRRAFLGGASTLALFPVWGFQAAAQPFDVEAFLELSRQVTGHSALDPRIAASLLAAFDEAGVTGDIVALSPDVDSPARQALLKAWYLGKIGPDGLSAEEEDEDLERAQGEAADEDDSQPDRVLAYEGTLMGVVVADLIPLRSYCGGLPHFWTDPPNDPDLQGGQP